ncbi:methyltransferase domain-containing protein [Cyanobacterium stanieri LEGE 03274]|uniref:Methyltransferase domain-containing protein n=1 Tax=Cyanobacterium stanieri LEGE 03274 TaxID=1828756 RepID=A0ABR9V4F8_9CHRO|nr:class I SAM-dependent methyltransferase [Cyanobacterium stanieri]MBE9222036.1 methyltransferase domain-containing protein [Cyanobacterium stanieri LEGE 03274]
MLKSQLPNITVEQITQNILQNANNQSSQFSEILDNETRLMETHNFNQEEFTKESKEFDHYIDLAHHRGQIRNNLPESFNHFPRSIFKPLGKLFLKVLSYIFKDQREVNFNFEKTLSILNKKDKILLESIENIFQNNPLYKKQRELEEEINFLKEEYKREREKNIANYESNNRFLQRQINDNFNKNKWEIEQLKLSIQELNKKNEDLFQKNIYLQKHLFQQEQHIEKLSNIDIKNIEGNLSAIKNIDNEIKNHSLDNFYLAFENKFRGDRQHIKKILNQDYRYLIDSLNINKNDNLFIDIGCGRGEWLEIIKELGYQGKGVDLNQIMVEDCNYRGLKVIVSDCVEYLTSLDDNSVDVITGFHIVEHLPLKTILDLFKECLRVLKPHGMVIFETPNPDNILVGSRNFYNDPTHRNPIPNATLTFMLESVGFPKVEVLKLHPIPNHDITGDELALRFSEYFYGCQDYAVIGFLQ